MVFLEMVEEHLHRLCVVFDQFREDNLKLKPLTCSLCKEDINYLVSNDGVQPRDSNSKAIVECAPPQTYMEVHAYGSQALTAHERN